TWTWDGTAWTRLSQAKHPPAREAASMAYDPGTGQMVLFGGAGTRSNSCLHSTCAWDGTTWARLSPSAQPSACAGMALALYQAPGQLALFGGLEVVHGRVRIPAQTWTWDGTTWTRQSPATHPAARYDASMAYDQATGQLVLFGGAVNSGKRTFG